MITAVTTCMGRRAHLELTLPHMLREFERVVVVDWSCPQRSGDFADEIGAQVIYCEGKAVYNGSSAKNLGAEVVLSEYICFVDADSFCMPGLVSELNRLVAPNRMVLSARNDDGTDVNDTVGFICCPTEAFDLVGGFDAELWQGWGHEDIHLRGKLLLDAKLEVVRLPHMMLGAIAHSNDLRETFREKPIKETAIEGFAKMVAWFESKGYPGYPNNASLRDITFNGQHAL